MDWTNSILSGLDERDAAERWKHERNIRRDKLLESKGSALWGEIVADASKGIEDLKLKRSDLAGVLFEQENDDRFVVRQIEYPAVKATITRVLHGLQLIYERSPEGRKWTQESRYVDFDVDDHDKLVMSHNGKRLITREDLLKFILAPVFRLPDA